MARQVEEALGGSKGSGEVYDAELSHVAALAACAANMRVFDESAWKSDVGRPSALEMGVAMVVAEHHPITMGETNQLEGDTMALEPAVQSHVLG